MTTCQTIRRRSRRWESASGRYLYCESCGADLCTRCRAAHLAPAADDPQWTADTLCPACSGQTGETT